MAQLLLLLLCGAAGRLVRADPAADAKLVQQHVALKANGTFRPPSGVLRFPYLVPAGPYKEMWDWDSLFMGVALADYGSIPYFAGTFMNFLDHTNATDGEVQGCIKPTGADGVIVHAKPVLLQGAWLATRHAQQHNPQLGAATLAGFEKFKPQMEALLRYWDVPPRKDPSTGLYVWHDQMQTGADDLVMSDCPAKYSPCWNEADDAFTLASVDLQLFLAREHTAYARFCRAFWAQSRRRPSAADGSVLLAAAARHEAKAASILSVMEKYLW